MSFTSTLVKEEEKLLLSARIDFGRISHNISQLIGYRQRIAQQLMDGKMFFNDESVEQMKALIEHVNNQIKQQLAL